MACKTVCKLCNKLIISTAVAFTSDNLIITIPDGAYQNCEKYCIVIAQSIPSTTIINAPVYIQIGSGTALYPLQKCDCSQATAHSIRTRTRYSTCVVTTPNGGSFRLLSKLCNAPNNNLLSINGTAPTITTPAE